LKELFEPAFEPGLFQPRRWTFSVQAGDRLANYTVSGPLAEEREYQGNAFGDVVVDGVETRLEQLPRTRLALAGLEFECARSEVAGWRLSNDPSRHEPAAACVDPPWHGFDCLDFPFDPTELEPESSVYVSRLRASVLEIGSGRPPGSACVDEVDIRLMYVPSTQLSWARFEWQGTEGVLVMSSPGAPLPFAVGSVLDIHHEVDTGWNAETLDVRDTSGRLLLWMGKGPWVERVVTPPELSLAVGPEQCASIPSGCSLASQYAIDFTRGGLTERLAYGAHQERDGYIFVHAGCDIGTVRVDDCYDGAPAGVTALMWAAP
jgi:hypothetical protein